MGSKACVYFSRITFQPIHEEIAKYCCIASSSHNMFHLVHDEVQDETNMCTSLSHKLHKIIRGTMFSWTCFKENWLSCTRRPNFSVMLNVLLLSVVYRCPIWTKSHKFAHISINIYTFKWIIYCLNNPSWVCVFKICKVKIASANFYRIFSNGWRIKWIVKMASFSMIEVSVEPSVGTL